MKLNQCLEGEGGVFLRPEASPTCFKGQGSAHQRWAEGAWPCLVVGSELHLVGCAVIEAKDGVAGLARRKRDQPRGVNSSCSSLSRHGGLHSLNEKLRSAHTHRLHGHRHTHTSKTDLVH